MAGTEAGRYEGTGALMTQGDEGPFRRKRIRLDRTLYGIPGATAFVTVAAAARQPVFANRSLTPTCIDALGQQAAYAQVAVLAYCFMPDHVHLLLRVDGDTNIITFLHAFKTRTTRIAWDHNIHGPLWQRSYYDHLLREHEDTSRYIQYVFENPIRRGLVTNWREYPFTGSFAYTFEDDSLWDAPLPGHHPH